MLQTISDLVSKYSPTVIYLLGVVVLFLRLEKAQQENARALRELIEQYHGQVAESIKTLAIINERLDR